MVNASERRDLPLLFDESLAGYHLYGVDLCLSARMEGLWNYALDCRLQHLGRRIKNESYYLLRRQLERKWRWRRFAWRRIPSKVYGPCGPIHLRIYDGFRH